MKCNSAHIKRMLALAAALMLAASPAAARSADKEEVVYATTDASGAAEGVYVVNIFGAGDVTDYGEYSSVRMMNTEDAISQADGVITFSSDAERVYYEGVMDGAQLPWLISVRYYLDGEELEPHEIAGRAGQARISIGIARNPECAGDFFDAYTLQLSLALDTDRFTAISAPGATEANVGSLKQLTYIVLPGNERQIDIEAQCSCFELDAISINGVRMELEIEPDTGSLDDVVSDIVDAIVQLDDGAQALSDGAVELQSGAQHAYDGAVELKSGAQALLDGVVELDGHSQELADGARSIFEALLTTANDQLEESRADFEELGIELSALTVDNYAAELERLMSELLSKVDEKVYAEADRTLEERVRAAVYDEVAAQVEAAAREQVRAQVEAAAAAKARPQVEAAV